MPNSTNVSAGKPVVAGAVFVAPKGTTLPTDASSTLSNTFKELGYLSEDGLTNTNSPSSTEIKAWGGDTVLTIQESKEDTFKFKLIEVLNKEVLKFIFGDGNVEVTAATTSVGEKIKIKANATEAVEHVLVFDMVLNGGYLKRIVVPQGKITEMGDIVYSDSEAVAYDVTLNAAPDTSANTHYEYIQAPTPVSSSS